MVVVHSFPVITFSDSGHFCGMAEMLTPVRWVFQMSINAHVALLG
jgi:hypothetical protein